MSRLAIPVSKADHIQGLENAPVTLVEYGDYQCPYCGLAYPIVKAVQERMGNRMRFVFRNFPLTEMHAHAFAAAQLAEAAGAAGKFWDMHDMLYEHQQALEAVNLRLYAQKLGLDPDGITAMAARADEKIRADFMGGVRSGVNGTPGFFINGQRHDGPWDFDHLLAAVEAAA